MLRDHPVIENMMATGYPDGNEPTYPICPVCGSECEDIYKHPQTKEIVGCDICIIRMDAYDCEALFEENQDADHETL